ncbi:DUF2194 domain-containing protein [Dialister sp.]|uniref:DUF2194 domain-containing protein n=1 Tax=Dialister sp. TaxID=1955814 RepID=UPI002E7FB9C5|nr:DUF2194 domain-containing protein [Dialister sp.]MEE3453164.1 DUF2194 domain-containing protein [Dialister sp.]
MNRKSIAVLIFIALLMGCFFQYTRMGGFLHMGSLTNALQQREEAARPWADAESIPRDHYYILYDPDSVTSMYAAHNTEVMLKKQKKSFEAHVASEEIPPIQDKVQGIFLATTRPGQVKSLPVLKDYVSSGGTVILLQRIQPSDSSAVSGEWKEALGIARLGSLAWRNGLEMKTSFLPGEKGKIFASNEVFQAEGNDVFQTEGNDVTLSADSTVEISTPDGMPVIWTHPFGKGRFIVFNSNERLDKSNAGFLASLIAHAGEDSIYPVVGVKIFFLDDFPAPVPKIIVPKLQRETGLNMAEFYRQEWWPFMTALAKKYNLRYTAGMIESYNNDVDGDFPGPDTSVRETFIAQGRELLAIGGELGLHGYNHQPLTLEEISGTGYTPWPDETVMASSLRELYRYAKSLYPDYDFRVYIPPSNILSEEGQKAVTEALPDIRVFSSLYNVPKDSAQRMQDFSRKDGFYSIPRISAGFMPGELQGITVFSAIQEMGVFSHFVHPDEILYDESRDHSWKDMQGGLSSFVGEISARFPWLTPVTVSESIPYFDDYFDLDYRIIRNPHFVEIHAWNFKNEARFLLHTSHTLDHADGAEARPIDEGTWYIRMKNPEARLYWKENP